MTHCLAFQFKLLLLTIMQVGLGEFFHLITQEVGLSHVLRQFTPHIVEFCDSVDIIIVKPTVCFQLRGIIGNDVHYVHLEILFSKQQVLMLAVYVDKMLSKLTQRGKCHWCVVDKCPTLASRTYLSSQQTLIGIVVEVVAVEERLDNARLIMTKPEHRLHDAF